MLFGHSELDSGRQACKKIKKKSFELDLSKEALFGQNGGGGRKVAPGKKSGGLFFWLFWLITCFHEQIVYFPRCPSYNKVKTCTFLLILCSRRVIPRLGV